MKYQFYVYKNTDFKKYCFVESDDKTEFVIWRNTRRITVKKYDYSVSFNMMTIEILKIFYDMVLSGDIYYKEVKDRPRRTHYINLDDEEYKMILDRRANYEV